MTENIIGYSQKKILELGLKLDEIFILEYFIRFKDTNAMKEEIIDGEVYYWLFYQKVIDDLPFLGIKSRRTLFNKFDALIACDVLKKKVVKDKKGTRTLFRTGDNYNNLVYVNQNINKNKKEQEEVDPIPYKEIIDYLNKTIGRKFQHTTSSSRTKIRSRWNDGYRLKDFEKVIDTKSEQWLNDFKMNKHLNPETLFGNKFEKYINEKGVNNENNKGYESVLEAKD